MGAQYYCPEYGFAFDNRGYGNRCPFCGTILPDEEHEL